jgi:hypothetical protein
MQTKFIRRKKEFAPVYFSVIFYKGKDPRRIPGKIDSLSDLESRFPGAWKAEVYQNGTHQDSAKMLDQIEPDPRTLYRN